MPEYEIVVEEELRMVKVTLNGEVGEWAGRPQVRIGPGARVVILKHAEDTPDF